jgi:ketosteroid isomerase-like protein
MSSRVVLAVSMFVFAASSATACSTPAPADGARSAGALDTAALRTTLQARLASVMGYVAGKQVDSLANAFTEDAVWIDGASGKATTGRAGIGGVFAAMVEPLESMTTEAAVVDHLVVVDSVTAVTFGHVQARFRLKGAATPVHMYESTVDHWVKGADGTWRIRYESNGQVLLPN